MIQTPFADIAFVWLDSLVWGPLCHGSLMMLVLTALFCDICWGFQLYFLLFVSALFRVLLCL